MITQAPQIPINPDHPNFYVGLMYNEFKDYAFDMHQAHEMKGHWREKAFKNSLDQLKALDLEIGTGNGYHFEHLAQKYPDRNILGIELKFKPLVQSIRRCVRQGFTNARITRFDATLLKELFEPQELNNVYIHHPDPWPRRRSWKNRLIQDDFLKDIYQLQKPGSYIDFKTDSLDYFNWSEERFLRGPYRVERLTRDLHQSEWASENFVTQFESIFLRKGQVIYYARLIKDQ